MIIAKNDEGYITDRGDILRRNDYANSIIEINNIKKPTNDELIELGKKYHDYYTKDQVMNNVQQVIEEMDKFDGNKL